MNKQPIRQFAISIAFLGLPILACESPVDQNPEPPPAGQFFFGDEATAEVERLLANALRTHEMLLGPQGAHFAIGRQLSLETAITAASESIVHYTEILEMFSGEAGQLDDWAAQSSCNKSAHISTASTGVDTEYDETMGVATAAVAGSQQVLHPARQRIQTTATVIIFGEDENGEEGVAETITRGASSSTGGACRSSVDDTKILFSIYAEEEPHFCIAAESDHTARTDSSSYADHRYSWTSSCDGDSDGVEGHDSNAH